MKIELSLKNYRCFQKPAKINWNKGFISFVGVNNAGKSALLRFIFEFRNLFALASNANGNLINSIVSDDRQQINLLQVLDNDEVFSNLNQNGIEFEVIFKFTDEEKVAGPLLPDRILMKISRNLYWKTEISVNGAAVVSATNNYGFQNKILVGDDVRKADLSEFFKLMDSLRNTLYIGPFRNIINIGTGEDYLDIKIGQAFIQQFRNLKTGNTKRQGEAVLKLTDDIRAIFGFNTLEINSSSDDKTLQIFINGRAYKPHELGSGISQFILVLANAAIKQPSYILIDEPELNLHPSLQLDFLTTLGTYAKEGVIFATHSIGLARSASDSVYSVRKISDGDSEVKPLESTARLAEFVGEMSFSNQREMGFDKILMVEGPTEIKTIQQFLRQIKKDHEILLLPLAGYIHGNSGIELEEVKRITPNVAALIDSERVNAGDALSTERQAFVDLCAQLTINCKVLDRRATENYFSDEAIKKAVGDSYRALSPYEKLADVNPHWGKKENWKIARAMTFNEIESTDLGRFLSSL